MRYALLAIASLALTAPALAQQPLEQPRTPDDGVGVDFSQPFMNDLLLRSERILSGNSIATNPHFSCEKERVALAEDVLNPALDQAYETCARNAEKFFREIEREIRREMYRDMDPRDFKPMPGPRQEPYKAQPNPPKALPRLPLAPDHPNAQR